MVSSSELYAFSDDQIFSIDLNSGATRQLMEFEFHGDEEPQEVFELDGNLVLMSTQNAMSITPDGELRYHEYFKAPGMSFWQKVGSVALTTAMTAASQ